MRMTFCVHDSGEERNSKGKTRSTFELLSEVRRRVLFPQWDLRSGVMQQGLRTLLLQLAARVKRRYCVCS